MKTRKALPAAFLALALVTTGCTGGSESKAADEATPSREAPAAQTPVDAAKAITSINSSIPLYEGADYRDDLTRRDEVMIRTRYGAGAKVYTLATDDSFPQVYHYYTTYLAQFRAFPAQETYPSEREQWRKLEVPLNQAMQDSFIPGQSLDPNGPQVLLQVAETEAEPKTVIRYIVMPAGTAPAAPPVAAATVVPAAPVAR
ncbi:MAG TPA: hypothetical protein VND45_12675 [Thermoanaerobaculia bacterium]|jgi:hypothetical protein|nr:hypothetical protein [Thermoanaerobaculia bacterium]